MQTHLGCHQSLFSVKDIPRIERRLQKCNAHKMVGGLRFFFFFPPRNSARFLIQIQLFSQVLDWMIRLAVQGPINLKTQAQNREPLASQSSPSSPVNIQQLSSNNVKSNVSWCPFFLSPQVKLLSILHNPKPFLGKPEEVR